MSKKILSLFTVLAILICTFSVSVTAEDFVPVLRFAVASDAHIGDSGSELEEARLAKLFTASYSYAEKQSYNKLDGVFFAGDISDNGTQTSMQKFFDIVNANVRPETTVRAVLGNHEFYTSSSTTVSRFLKVSGYSQADTDFVLGGYHFIMMCPQSGGSGYTSSQKSWLKKQLSADADEDKSGTKPIFVFQHHNVKNTVYGSQAWGITALSDILAKYPQVVDFSGHSHYPINDPRSIWQGTFTALNDGTLSYYEMGIAGVTDHNIYTLNNMGGYGTGRSISRRDAAQFYIVEVDKNSAIRVKGYDLLSDTFICEYNIPSVGNTGSFIYTDARKEASTPPAFGRSAAITLKGTPTDSATFEIPQAAGTDVVQHYRFEVYDGQNNLVTSAYTLSDTFFFPNPKTLRCTVKGLSLNTNYLVKCYAVNCWEKESYPLTLKFTTGGEPEISCHASPVTPDVFSFVQLENGPAYDGVSGTKLSNEGNPLPFIDELTGRCAAEFNGNNTYSFNGFKNYYSQMKSGVSFEFYGTLTDIDFKCGKDYVDVLSNQQSGGCGLELTNSGQMEFYVNVDGSYVHPGASVPFGEPVHCVGTYNGQIVKLYINGVLANYKSARGSVTFPSNTTAQFLCIGGDSNTNGDTEANFTGSIVAANVYGKALTDYEVEQLYNQYKTFDFIPESGFNFDLQNRLLSGLDLSNISSQSIKNAFRNTNLYVENNSPVGTGTQLQLRDSKGNVYDTAEVVIFGDVNGDGWYDGQDAVIVSCIANGVLKKEQVGKAEYAAADCNHDGVINSSDVLILEQAGVLLAQVDQSKPAEELLETSSAYNEYLSLIDQTPVDIEPANRIQKFFDIIFNLLIRFVNYLKLHFAILK